MVHSGIRLTTPAERRRIADLIAERTASLPAEDLDVLGFDAWEHALLAGVAAHHAGLLPAFKETVEALFAEGLVKVVFATETLALGINMPARSVVLERLVKWDGSTHAAITAGEYTQLTGRAGPTWHRRRGSRRRALCLRAGPGRAGGAGLAADLPVAQLVPARPTTWRST